MKSHVGIIGLAVMGANFARNFASKNIPVSVFNRTFSKTEELLSHHYPNMVGFESLEEFVQSLETPRKIFLLVKSGPAVEETIEHLTPLLDPEDIIIDCGNSNWKDTVRRQEQYSNFTFVGCGISGGEFGALYGPSLMPGGKSQSIEALLPFLQQVAAKDFHNQPCVTNVGQKGSGHFVKMVHNGIEYSIMQGISEIYDVLRNLSWSNQQICEAFTTLNQGSLESFLLEITIRILTTKDSLSDDYLLDLIVNKAQSKGTGSWTVESAMEFGVYAPSIAAAVFARTGSAKNQQFQVSPLSPLSVEQSLDTNLIYQWLNQALYLVYLTSYLQGLDIIDSANKNLQWGIDIMEVIRIWQGGCIIRSGILKDLGILWTSKIDFEPHIDGLVRLIELTSVPKPVLRSTLDYILTVSSFHLPTNLIQAQRDYFGAHTYLRTDRDGVFTGGWDM